MFFLQKKTALAIALLFCTFGAIDIDYVAGAREPEKDPDPAAIEFFEKQIRPALIQNCLKCHSGEKPQGNLRLDFRGGWETGGDSGPAIMPGDPDNSPLIRAIRHEGPETPMPMGGHQLTAELLAAFERWVRIGAPDPRDVPPAHAVAWDKSYSEWGKTFDERRRWWSLRPVVQPPVPEVKQTEWSHQAVDRFILAQLEAKGLAPAPRADRNTLLRRLSYVLTGLPPTSEEMSAFLRESDPGAYAWAVDRLLASPHFGERWARHWMDVVRYSDTYGYEEECIVKGSWRFRDYLIRAFNADIPFDQLVREHIAGDLLPRPRIDASNHTNESLIGPTWFQMGENRHGDSLQFNGIHQEMVDNKIDAFSKAFQATTVACARCHDHKFDAISQPDYYALAGVFMSSRWVANTLDTPDRNRQILDKLAALKPKLRKPVAAWWLEQARKIPQYLLTAQARLNGDTDTAQVAAKLDPDLLSAWEEALSSRPEKKTTPSDDAEKASQSDKKPDLENPLFPWLALRQAVKDGKSIEAAWLQLAQDYAGAGRERAQSNAQNFSLVADFRSGKVPEGWSLDGVGLRHGLVRNGDFTVALEGPEAVGMLLPGGLFTHALSPRLNGAVRTPYLNLSGHPYISMEVSGGDLSAHRIIVDNAFRTERQAYIQDHRLHWLRLSTAAYEKSNRVPSPEENAEIRVYVELATKASNPNFPPRPGLGPDLSEKQMRDAHSWFGVTRALLHDKDESPADELTRFTALFAGDPPPDLTAVAARYGQWLSASVEAWAQDRANEDDVLLINWMRDHALLPNELLPRNMDARKSIWELVAAYRALEEQLVEPQTVVGMADLDPGRDHRLNVRGVYEQLGDRVPRGYVKALADDGARSKVTGSGRLELANLIASPDNPLTARVFVNRVWHWVFGTGLVRTTDDFGHLGERPSHLELLDYLANWFVQNGWSVKKLVRMLVLSETFQQSGQISAHAREVDPTNRLLHHYPLRRLDAESIRDSMLAVSGRLDPRLYGPPVDPYRPPQNEPAFKNSAQWVYAGPLDGNGRRSIYIRNTILSPPKFLSTFNKPSPKIPTGSRDVTNVPAQALTLMNDPFVAGQAEFWARQLIAASHKSPEERLTVMFQRAFGRDLEAQELPQWIKAVHDINTLYQKEASPNPVSENMMPSLPVWKDVAHAIFNTKEFIYVR